MQACENYKRKENLKIKNPTRSLTNPGPSDI